MTSILPEIASTTGDVHQPQAGASVDLIAELARLQKENAALRETLQSQGFEPKLADVLSITHELFPGRVGIELMFDPEEPEEHFVVVTVSVASDATDVIKRQLDWHHRVAETSPGDSGPLRLSIV